MSSCPFSQTESITRCTSITVVYVSVWMCRCVLTHVRARACVCVCVREREREGQIEIMHVEFSSTGVVFFFNWLILMACKMSSVISCLLLNRQKEHFQNYSWIWFHPPKLVFFVYCHPRSHIVGRGKYCSIRFSLKCAHVEIFFFLFNSVHYLVKCFDC